MTTATSDQKYTPRELAQALLDTRNLFFRERGHIMHVGSPRMITYATAPHDGWLYTRSIFGENMASSIEVMTNIPSGPVFIHHTDGELSVPDEFKGQGSEIAKGVHQTLDRARTMIHPEIEGGLEMTNPTGIGKFTYRVDRMGNWQEIKFTEFVVWEPRNSRRDVPVYRAVNTGFLPTKASYFGFE